MSQSDKINILFAKVDDLKNIVEKHNKLLSGLDKLSIFDVSDVKAMPIAEIEKCSMTRGVIYNESDDCLLAAVKSKIFFANCCPVMCPKVISGVLYSPSGGIFRNKPNEPVIAGKPDAGKPVYGDAFALSTGGCVWEKRTDILAPAIELNTMGYNHFVTLVDSEDGTVAVDWGLGNFSNIPEDILLFLCAGSAPHEQNILSIPKQ